MLWTFENDEQTEGKLLRECLNLTPLNLILDGYVLKLKVSSLQIMKLSK